MEMIDLSKKSLPSTENIYETDCPILYAMEIISQKWKLPILWYIADAENQTLRYKELERKVVGIRGSAPMSALASIIHLASLHVIPVLAKLLPAAVPADVLHLRVAGFPRGSRNGLDVVCQVDPRL